MDRNPGPVLPTRKHPAHMPPVERHNMPVILFVTLSVQPRGSFLANTVTHAALLEACRDADAWNVGRYVIMPDHVHLFCAPARWPRVPIQRWAAYLKERLTKRLKATLEGETAASRSTEEVGWPNGEDGSAQLRPPAAHRGFAGTAGRRTAVAQSSKTSVALPWRWQPDCWDTQMRNVEHFRERWEYVRQNPVRAGLVARPDDWPWQGEMHVVGW